MWNNVTELFREYMGTGLTVILFVLCLIYLWVNEKRQDVRILFLYMPLAMLVLFFNPLVSTWVYGIVGDEIYYRILWLLPVTLTLAYTGASLYGRFSGGKKGLAALGMAGIIVVSGSYVYGNPYFHRAENLCHVPDSVVRICDAIQVPGREVMAVFPRELLQYVRQYSPVTCMPYGRELLVSGWTYGHSLFGVMEEEVIDLERLVPLTREEGCHYIVLRDDKEIIGIPEEYGWSLLGKYDGYIVYRDEAIELTVPDLSGQNE